MNELLSTRGAFASDANALVDIDIKCHEYPWSAEEWAKTARSTLEWCVTVATYRHDPIGFIVYRDSDDGYDTEVCKIAVKQQYRRIGVGSLLMASAVAYSNGKNHQNLFTVVPESSIYPPEGTAGLFLAACGLQATPVPGSKSAFIPNYFSAYGQSEAGVRFAHALRSTDA